MNNVVEISSERAFEPIQGPMVDRARSLALAAHKGQPYGEGLGFSYHLTAVAGMVCTQTTDTAVITAAWLHDIVEDCEDFDKEVIATLYGHRVAHLVDLVSDVPGKNRRERKSKTMQRVVTDRDAVLIKLADRYANQQASILTANVFMCSMYLEELDEFLAIIWRAGYDKLVLFDMVSRQRGPMSEVLGIPLQAGE